MKRKPIKRIGPIPQVDANPSRYAKFVNNNLTSRSSGSIDINSEEFSWDEFLEDLASADYEIYKKLKERREPGSSGNYTWDDYIIDRFIGRIKYIKDPQEKELAIQRVLKSNQLSDKEKFKLIYSNLDKVSKND